MAENNKRKIWKAIPSCSEKLLQFLRQNPRQLILERDDEIRNKDPNSRTGIRDLILDFIKYLEKRGLCS